MSSFLKDPKHVGAQPIFDQGKEQKAPGMQHTMQPEPDYGLNSYIGHKRLEGRNAIVTGADSGIGRAVALAFAREGADIICAYLNEDKDAEQTKSVVESTGRRCVLVKGDLSKDESCKLLIKQSAEAFGGTIHILVNNHAYQGKSLPESIASLDFDRAVYTMKTNVVAFMMCIKYVLPYMPAGGAIINTGSIQAYSPSGNIIDYACSKGAITSLTKGLAPELINKGIRVNQIAPGPVWTPLIEASFPQSGRRRRRRRRQWVS